MQPRVTDAVASPAAKEETMTKPKLVFNPVLAGLLRQSVRDLQADARRSADLLRRARGLLRADPARRRGGGVQGPRVVLVGPRMRPGDGAVCRSRRRSRSSSWTRRTIATCAACSTRRSRRGPIQSQRETVVELVEHYLSKVDPRQLRRRAGLLRPVPRRGDHPDGRGARGVPPAGPALDRQGPGTQAGTDRAVTKKTCRPTSTRASTTTA